MTSLPTSEASCVQKQNIEWNEINFKVGNKVILDTVWGKVSAGQVCAIMGPSGSGKSSLLNVLAGRSAPSIINKISGSVMVDNKPINPVDYRKNIAYVMQDDALMATSTPREALQFSAALRLPKGTSIKVINDLVDTTLNELGLAECADVLIGGPLITGISGGQRKRTSVGVEIITKPSLLFLDEPTSGLDSFSAFNCINLLKRLADNNATVLCTIHQPSSEVFFLFDTCIFLKDGLVCYHGPVKGITQYFSAKGLECPANYNPSDYIMYQIQTIQTIDLKSRGLIMTVTDSEDVEKANYKDRDDRKDSIASVGSDPADAIPLTQATYWEQLKWLTYREYLNTIRDYGALIGRFGITIFLNLLFGIIFFNVGGKDNSDPVHLQDHFGGVTFTVISAMFGAAQPIMLMFPFERPLFMREYSTGTYSASPYFISKVILEMPLTFLQTILQFILVYYMMNLRGSYILLVLEAWALGGASSSVAMALGASVSNVKDVTELAPLLFVPQLLFAGFFIRTSNIPDLLRWAQYLCGIKYTMNLVLLTEFNSKLPSCQGDAAEACKAIIDTNDISGEYWWVYILLLGVLWVGFRVLALIILVYKARRFY